MNAYGSSNSSYYSNNGYGFGNSTSTASGSYNSTTTTTITGPGSFTFYDVPYSTDYYDQYAIYLVKKYYFHKIAKDYYSKPDIKFKVGILKAGQKFEVINWCGNGSFLKIKIENQILYTDCNDDLW